MSEVTYRLSHPGMFLVPDRIVDEHLKLARELHLKVLLWLCRHGGRGERFGELAAWLGKPEESLLEALAFWVERGILTQETLEEPEESPESSPEHLELSPEHKSSSESDEISIRESPKALAPPQVVKALAPPQVVKALAPPQVVKREAPPQVAKREAPPKVAKVVQVTARPSPTQLLQRSQEDRVFAALCAAADQVLGRTIGYEGQCVLLQLYDGYGLPTEVIFMLLEYCVGEGKGNNRYIETVGLDWAEREIDSIERAAEEISQIRENKQLWNALQQYAGLHLSRPTTKQSAFLRTWNRYAFSIEMICLAYEETADRTGKLSFAYMNKILEGWHAAGLKTPEQVAAAHQDFLDTKTQAKAKSNSTPRKASNEPTQQPSYDLAAYEQRALEPPVFKNPS